MVMLYLLAIGSDAGGNDMQMGVICIIVGID